MDHSFRRLAIARSAVLLATSCRHVAAGFRSRDPAATHVGDLRHGFPKKEEHFRARFWQITTYGKVT